MVRHVCGLLVRKPKLKWVTIRNVIITITANLDDIQYKCVKGL